jgi:hypothetical protein
LNTVKEKIPKITFAFAKYVAAERHKGSVYHTNQLIRYADTFCRLKSYSPDSSFIKDFSKNRNAIVSYCEVKTTTFYQRLKWMEQEGWIQRDGVNIRMISWYDLHERLGITYDKQFFIKPKKIENEKTSFYWIYLAEIQHNKNSQAYMICKKLNKNLEVKTALYVELQKQGVSIERCDKEPAFFVEQLNQLYIKSFRFGSAIHDLLVHIRPDTNRSCIGLGKAWHGDTGNILKKKENPKEFNRYASQGTYVKRKMSAEKIAVVQSIGTIESDCRMHNSKSYVIYRKETKTTFQAFCDDILVRPDIDITNLQFALPDAA